MFEVPERPASKQVKDEKKVPLAFFIILIVVVISILGFLIWLMFQKPLTQSPVMENPAAVDVAQSGPVDAGDPFDVTAVPREEGKIIISTVEYEAGNIARISLILPQNLVGNELYVVDNPVDMTMESSDAGQIAYIDLPLDLQAKEVELSFRSGGNQQAMCRISIDDVSNPTGDCTW